MLPSIPRHGTLTDPNSTTSSSSSAPITSTTATTITIRDNFTRTSTAAATTLSAFTAPCPCRLPHHRSEFLHNRSSRTSLTQRALPFRIPVLLPHVCPTPRRHPLSRIVAVQARPVSSPGDSDGGELRDQVTSPPTQKSFSVGVTIVSAFDATLRRQVIERIVTQADAGRVVVVTTGGLASTDETDGPGVTSSASDSSVVSNESKRPPDQLNGVEHSDVISESQPQSDDIAAPSLKHPNGVTAATSSPAVANLEGWIACSSRDEMLQVVLKLAASRDCDYIVAENAMDVDMEPQDLAQLLQSRGGASLRIDTLVSVFDGDTLLNDLTGLPSSDASTPDAVPSTAATDSADAAVGEDAPVAPAEPHPIHDSDQQRPMMVVSLVENSNVVVLRQRTDERVEQMSRVQNIVSVLNGNASIVPATGDTLPVELLINTNLYNTEDIRYGATWKKVLMASRNVVGNAKPTLSKVVKESTFLYKAKRPFHPTRLYEHIKDVATFAGVIRSAGRIWLATRKTAPLEWNQAGVAATLRLGKLFWAETPEDQWPESDEERNKIRENWDTQFGDRETEMVFVGIGIDKERLQGLLDGCLLQDEEMVFNNMWENLDDPFVQWVPLLEDDDESAEDIPAVSREVEDVTEGVVTAEPRVATQTDPGDDVIPIPNENIDADTNAIADDVDGGIVDDVELPNEAFEKISALEIFDSGFEDEESRLIPQTKDDSAEDYNQDDAVIASWEGAEADGILTQIPRYGLPVTLVTGFLGSGKTTLLNYILTADHGLRIAVLVNEFGEIDIDNQLVQKGDWNSDEVMELSNGCICCDINDSFVSAVQKILERKESIDYMLIETTGVADPAPVVNSLMATEIADEVRLDGVLTLVDAENFDVETHMGSDAALSQVMMADTILLSKTDLASGEKVDEVVSYIREVRPAARILRSRRGRVPLDLILDVGMRVTDSPAHMDPTKEVAVGEHDEDQHGAEEEHAHTHEHSAECHDHGDEHDHSTEHKHDHDHDHDHDDCTHESHSHVRSNHLEADGFMTTSFKSDRALDAQLFMDKFLQNLPEGVFRAKGLLYFHGFGERYIFQLSGRRYHMEMDDWPEDVAPGNQLVIIGRDLELEELRKTLEECHAVEEV